SRATARRPAQRHRAAKAKHRNPPGPCPPALSGAAARLERRARSLLRLALTDAEFLLHHVEHPAIGAHLQPIQRTRRSEHRVAGKLGEHAADDFLGTERFAAAYAVEDGRFVEHARLARRATEQQAGLERDRVFGASRDTEPALHALGLDEAQLRS